MTELQKTAVSSPPGAARAYLLAEGDSLRLSAAFDRATPRTLWSCDLKKESSLAFSLKEESGRWVLGFTQGSGAFVPVAFFDAERDAERAYTVMGRALLSPRNPVVEHAMLRFFSLLIIGLALLFFLFVPVGEAPSGQPTQVVDVKEKSGFKQKPIVNGVPMNADDVLKPPAD